MILLGIIIIWWLYSSFELYKTNSWHEWNFYLVFIKILEFFSIM